MALRHLRTIACTIAGAAIASASLASRVGGPAAPASSVASSTRSSAQPAEVQADESASLRSGTITALGEHGDRLQVQEVWLAVGDTTLVVRQGKPVRLDSLRAGDAIRFILAPGASDPASIRLIYAP